MVDWRYLPVPFGFLAAYGLLVASGCSGSIEGSIYPPDAGGGHNREGIGTGVHVPDGRTTPGTTSPNPPTDPAAGPKACLSGAPGRVPPQRLTRAEYRRTVQDLFSVDGRVADRFPPDPVATSFDNNAELLTFSPLLTELFMDAAEIVAAEALQRDRARIMVCNPATAGRDACARAIISATGRRVFRRPLTDQEREQIVALFAVADREGEDFDGGVKLALQALLSAPQFLLRWLPGAPSAQRGAVVRLDPFALATRLSYFIWGSTPDDALLDAAAAARLNDSAGIRAELNRMLASSKAEALFDRFARQWLSLDRLAEATPNPGAFPTWSEALRVDMEAETRAFFLDILARKGSPLALLTGHTYFLNERLGRHYGLDIKGPDLRPVEMDPAQRSGIVTQASVLTMTSEADETHVIKRGLFIAGSLLCAEPPPPMEGVPPLEERRPNETKRQQLERHRSDTACVPCHRLIDPLGFALENYDPVGRWRTTEREMPVDNVGALPDGRPVVGGIELTRLLAEGPEFRTCLARRLATYALGRELGPEDQCLIDRLAGTAATRSLPDLLLSVVESDAFQMHEVGP